MEELEGRLDAVAVQTLVRSAAAAGMNMIRVWGGGVYPPSLFFDACDSLGILLYVDMQFAGSGHDIAVAAAQRPLSAAANASILAEVAHQVRRLSAHPSVFLFDGANEVIAERTGPSALYASLVMEAVAREDNSRVVWPSSPAAGWLSGVDRLWGTPNGEPLIALVGSQCHIWSCANERHGTYQAGVGAGSWMTVMTDPWSQAHTFDPGMPLAYLPGPGAPAGVGAPSVFASEFGATSMQSFEAMSATLAPSSWGLHGGGADANCTPTAGNKFLNNCTGPNAMAQRSWACDNLVWSYFGPALLNASGEAAFKGQLFQCLIASALNMKGNIESRRASNQLGTIVWQLNEIWAAGGWGLVEYSGAPWGGSGTLRGGRWKPINSWLELHLFADVMSACGFVGRGRDFACFVSNARADTSFEGTLALLTVDLRTGALAPWGAAMPVAVAPGPGALSWLTPSSSATLPNASTTLLLARLADASGASVEEHLVHLTAPVNLLAPRATLTATVAASPNADGSANVTIASDAVALFVTLTCMAPGRFSDQAFLLLPSAPRVVTWLPFEADSDAAANLALLRGSLRVEDHSLYASAQGL